MSTDQNQAESLQVKEKQQTLGRKKRKKERFPGPNKSA